MCINDNANVDGVGSAINVISINANTHVNNNMIDAEAACWLTEESARFSIEAIARASVVAAEDNWCVATTIWA